MPFDVLLRVVIPILLWEQENLRVCPLSDFQFACSVSSHCLNQCWLIANWTLSNKLKLNYNQIAKVFIHKNAFECVAYEMASILSRPRCVKEHGASVNRVVLEKSRSAITIIHYDDVIMSAMASQITSLTIVYSIVYSGADQRKHQSSASLAFVRGIHRWPVNSPHKWPAKRKIFAFDDVIME